MSEKTLTLRRAVLAAIFAGNGGFPANFTSGILINIASNPDSILGFRVQAGLAIAADQTARVDVNRKAGTMGATVEIAAQAAQIGAESSTVTDTTDVHIINAVPNAESPVLRHAAERRPAAQRGVHQHLRRSINDRQSVSAS
jgi:hypothetical protein